MASALLLEQKHLNGLDMNLMRVNQANKKYSYILFVFIDDWSDVLLVWFRLIALRNFIIFIPLLNIKLNIKYKFLFLKILWKKFSNELLFRFRCEHYLTSNCWIYLKIIVYLKMPIRQLFLCRCRSTKGLTRMEFYGLLSSLLIQKIWNFTKSATFNHNFCIKI